MNDDAPLSSNERALAISVLVVGGIILLVSLFTIAGAAYALATGHPMGGQATKAFSRAFERNERMRDMMDRQVELQGAIQIRWAPKQLAAEGAYFVAVAATMLFAVFALKSGKHRARVGQLAAVVAAVRIAVGLVTYLLTSELMKATTGSMVETMAQTGKGLSGEKAEALNRGVQGAMAGLSALSAGCWTLVVCIYFAVVAYVFLVAKRPEAPRAA